MQYCDVLLSKPPFDNLESRQQMKTKTKENDAVEAYGAKGMNSKPWRKVFKSTDALNAWLEKNDAVCYGVREPETGLIVCRP